MGTTAANGKISITNFKLAPGDAACAKEAASGLPWLARATSDDRARIVEAVLSGKSAAECGPGALPFKAETSGVWRFTKVEMSRVCMVSASFAANPPITVTP
jgi:hypothetical protein